MYDSGGIRRANHCEKLGFSLQQYLQGQSFKALLYAEPQPGPLLPLCIFPQTPSHFLLCLAISMLFHAIQGVSGYSKIFHLIPGHLCCSSLFNLFMPIWTIQFIVITRRGFASLKLCEEKAASLWSQKPFANS